MSKFNRDYYNSRASWREFKVNEYLTVKFKRGGPHIYVKDKLFHSCSNELVLMLNFPVEDKKQYSSIDGFVEATGIASIRDDWPSGFPYNVDKRTEFWGCCSNLQAWAENDYNPNLLFSQLAFPLLQILTDAGDHVAKKAYKKEIVKRMLRTPPIITTKELGYLDEEERIQILTRVLSEFLKRAKKDKYEFRVFTILINEIKGSELILEFYDAIEEQFLAYLTNLESWNLDKYRLWQNIDLFSDLVNSANNSKLWNKNCERIITYYKVLIKQIITVTEGWDPDSASHMLVAFDDQKVPYHEIEPYLTASRNAILTGRSYPEGDEMTFLINGEEISINDIALSQYNDSQNWALRQVSRAGTRGYLDVPPGHPLASVNFPQDVDDIGDSNSEGKKFTYQDFTSCLNKNPYFPGMYHSFYKFILTLVEMTKDTELFAGFLRDLVIIFPKLPKFGTQFFDLNQRPDVYSNLIKAAKGTALESKTVFHEWKERIV